MNEYNVSGLAYREPVRVTKIVSGKTKFEAEENWIKYVYDTVDYVEDLEIDTNELVEAAE